MKELLALLVRSLVSEPERVSVEERVGADEVHLELSVAPSDRGRVVGRKGATVQALRTLLDAVARQRGVRCQVEMAE